MTITAEWLKKHKACKEGVRFFEINFPEGLDLDRVKIKGDFNNYYRWIENILKCQFEYDASGNVTKKIYPNGAVYRFEYDESGNVNKKIDPWGAIYRYEYDKFGNMIKEVWPNGDVYQYEHDEFGNIIKRIWPSGNVDLFEYLKDNKNRLTEIKKNDKSVCRIKYLD